ncbi:hypothetical protein EB796_004518 [Bugula neritina]|uniref:Uncharacterized protein n=1 Tax=Bugula neritina TaxID=10212 RepID=A0A7J7KFZ3_BUGNE|nr:hypothetical protein EB796_004518 [Bugula neritina]
MKYAELYFNERNGGNPSDYVKEDVTNSDKLGEEVTNNEQALTRLSYESEEKDTNEGRQLPNSEKIEPTPQNNEPNIERTTPRRHTEPAISTFNNQTILEDVIEIEKASENEPSEELKERWARALDYAKLKRTSNKSKDNEDKTNQGHDNSGHSTGAQDKNLTSKTGACMCVLYAH